MESSVGTNLEKLLYIVERDKNYCLSQNILNINLENTSLSIAVSNIANVRIKKRRDLTINYFIIISILGVYLLINRMLFFDAIIDLLVNVVTIICVFLALFVSRYSYEVLINYKGFNYSNFKLAQGKFDK